MYTTCHGLLIVSTKNWSVATVDVVAGVSGEFCVSATRSNGTAHFIYGAEVANRACNLFRRRSLTESLGAEFGSLILQAFLVSSDLLLDRLRHLANFSGNFHCFNYLCIQRVASWIY